MDCLKFFFTSKDKRQPLLRFLQQLNHYNENHLVSKLIDDVLVSHYASLTTKAVILYGP